jgi:polysaccharide deacetylase 2 family uncharacterized protein YibQ
MAKHKRKYNIGFILTVVALLAAAIAWRVVLKSGIKIHKPGMQARKSVADIPESFEKYLETLNGPPYLVKKISSSPDSGAFYHLLVEKGKPLVLVNLELSSGAGQYGFTVKEAYEDVKKQWLRLLYSQGDTIWVRVLVKRRPDKEEPEANLKPRICIVLYDWPPKESKTAQSFLNFPEIGTVVVSRQVNDIHKAVLVALPLEPKGYPREDPGPDAILVDQPAGQIKVLADKALKKYRKAVGFYALFGSRALEDDRVCGEIIKYCASKGLIFFEPQRASRSLAASLAEQERIAYFTPDILLGRKTTGAEAVGALKKALVQSRASKTFVLAAPANVAFLRAAKEVIDGKTRTQFDFVTPSMESR